MNSLAVQIVRLVRNDQPGWVACEFADAAGHVHTFIEKGPVVSDGYPDAASVYPQPGSIGCESLNRWFDEKGFQLVRINTERPFGIESVDGLSEFIVREDQLAAFGDEK